MEAGRAAEATLSLSAVLATRFILGDSSSGSRRVRVHFLTKNIRDQNGQVKIVLLAFSAFFIPSDEFNFVIIMSKDCRYHHHHHRKITL